MRYRTPALGLAICVVVGTLFTGCESYKKIEPLNTESRVPAEGAEQGDVTWDAHWIWGDFNEPDSWLMARKSFTLDEVPDGPIRAGISCDSKYWLYVNGQVVVRDGNLKRGRSPKSIYYDVVDVSSYLTEGENVIALRVWYFGKDTALSYLTSGQGALLFQMDVGDERIISDETWSVRRDSAFDNTHNRANPRLAEYDIYYIAEKEPEGWTKASYDETTADWESARVLGDDGAEPWGELVSRDIPMFYDSDELEYENVSKMPWEKEEGYTTKKAETFEMVLPYNAQVYPMLSVESEAGKEIVIKSDAYEDTFGNSVMTTYVTKDGKQSFETPGWMNGEKIIYEIPEGVTIKRLTYRETGYAADISGSFSSDDEFYNELWQKSARSVYVNMRDFYMDCPNRERSCWIADLGVESLVSQYSMSPGAMDLYAGSLRTVFGNQFGTIIFSTNASSQQTLFLLQGLMLIPSVNEYYLYTGDASVVEDAYEPLCAFLTNWTENETGLYDCTLNYPYFQWGDSTENVDYAAVENAWLCMAFSSLEDMAGVLGNEEDAAEFCKKKESLQEAFRSAYWTKDGYQSDWVKTPDDRANAMAVLSGIATEDQYDIIAKVLQKKSNATPFMEYYIERALCEMGRMDLAQKRMKDRYGVMINARGEKDTSTLWEYFNYKEGTSNHGWSAGPLILMSRYMVGIRPLSPGYEVYEIKPDMGELKEVSTSMETVHGKINVELSREKKDEPISMKVTQPKDVTARIAWEKSFGEPTISAEEFTVADEDETYRYYDVKGETIEIQSDLK